MFMNYVHTNYYYYFFWCIKILFWFTLCFTGISIYTWEQDLPTRCFLLMFMTSENYIKRKTIDKTIDIYQNVNYDYSFDITLCIILTYKVFKFMHLHIYLFLWHSEKAPGPPEQPDKCQGSEASGARSYVNLGPPIILQNSHKKKHSLISYL